jgi:hypothetical protein
MAAFNASVPDVRGVHYASYVGWVNGGVRDVHALLAPGFTYLSRRTGNNDGMVPAASQRWGEVLGEVNADHWAQIGWSRGLDARSFYAAIARALARFGCDHAGLTIAATRRAECTRTDLLSETAWQMFGNTPPGWRCAYAALLGTGTAGVAVESAPASAAWATLFESHAA